MKHKAIEIAIVQASQWMMGKSICEVADQSLDYIAKKVAKYIVEEERKKQCQSPVSQ